jgi:hypothetical protein
MKSYSIEYTRSHLKGLMSELPYKVTRYGKVLSLMVGYTANVVQDTSVTKLPSNNNKRPPTCPHGSMWGNCKKGCK